MESYLQIANGFFIIYHMMYKLSVLVVFLSVSKEFLREVFIGLEGLFLSRNILFVFSKVDNVSK
jgi:hypothetical protein